MEAGLQELVAFYLTGKGPGDGLEAVGELELRPALLASYRDLTRLRYDFPLVLVDDSPAARTWVQSLSAIVDGLVSEIAPGDDADRLTRHVLRLEQMIRASVAAGASGSLSALWEEAARRIEARGGDGIETSLERARAALKVDGQVIDCDREMPARVLRHTWSAVEKEKAARARHDIDKLILKLSDILRADFAHSETGRSADNLKAMVGTVHAEMFDFDTMSRLLGRSSTGTALPESRRRRIEQLLTVLKSQRFFGPPTGKNEEPAGLQPHTFEFHDCHGALAAYRERMPDAIELAKAMAIAELEIDSQYSEAKHDVLFTQFGADGLDPEDMARFPDYLVVIDAAQLRGAESDTLLEILSAGLPMKLLVQTDDILDEPGVGGDDHLSVGLRSRQLSSMTIGLNDVYLLQASGSHLYKFRERIVKGLAVDGPAVFSVFSGASSSVESLPPYLVAAAAMESRAFPAFTYDPTAGDDWAARFSLEGNSQVDLDWPVQRFTYEDEEHQRVETTIDFTLVDFAACDHRLVKHFARVPRTKWNGHMVPVRECLGRDARGVPEQIPSILMVDGENSLQQVIVEDKLIRATRRCRDAWHSLQELGGIHNSHVERLLARERQEWEARQAREAPIATAPKPVLDGTTVAVPAAPAAEAEPAVPEPAPSSDDAYIESARCTSCNECIQINNKMFAYDENKQCHIVDLGAGTYRELVEAAESCQVAIIHPGKPRNSNEPGLDDLIQRAEAFR